MQWAIKNLSAWSIVEEVILKMFHTDGLAWDWATKKVYWTDSGRRRVEVYDPERDVRKQLINTGPNTLPRDIVVDPSTG